MVNINVVKKNIIKFKLNHCCWLAPVHYGAIALGYLNLIITVTNILATVNDSFSPMLKRLQEEVLEDDAHPVTACILAYSAEEAIDVLLLVGMHRRDLTLLDTYIYLATGVVLLMVFTYVMVFLKIDFLISTLLVMEILYQSFLLLLVRSTIVNIKEERKKCMLGEDKDKPKITDLEIGEESASEQEYEVNEENVDPDYKKLDTLLETSDEESIKNEN